VFAVVGVAVLFVVLAGCAAMSGSRRGRHRAPSGRLRRASAAVTSAALVATMSTLLPVAAAQAADEALTVATTGDATVLVGSPIGYTLTATNGGGTPLYNLSLRAELPVGVSYEPGSTSVPKGLPDPTIATLGTAPNTHQVLVWTNVSDLPAGADQALSFRVTVDPTVYPVGSTVSSIGSAYAQSDPAPCRSSTPRARWSRAPPATSRRPRSSPRRSPRSRSTSPRRAPSTSCCGASTTTPPRTRSR
jgi:uncharacterized repeat protein (TIGR01451 family)